MSTMQRGLLKWAAILGTAVGAATGAAAVHRPEPQPAGEVPAVVSAEQWAEVRAQLKVLDQRTARIETRLDQLLQEGRR